MSLEVVTLELFAQQPHSFLIIYVNLFKESLIFFLFICWAPISGLYHESCGFFIFIWGINGLVRREKKYIKNLLYVWNVYLVLQMRGKSVTSFYGKKQGYKRMWY